MVMLTLPDGSIQEHKKGVIGAEIAASIGPRLAKAALAIEVNGKVWDLNRPIENDARIRILTFQDDGGKYAFHHSTAHIMAHAVQRLFPHAKNTIGPPVEEGFYYDFDFGDYQLTEEDLPRIEAEMREIVKFNYKFEKVDWSLGDVRKNQGENEYKLELAEEFAKRGEGLTAYKDGDFIDLCEGPHVPSTGYIKALKVMKIAGAYWRGDAKSKMLTRIYGISFPSEKELRDHLTFLEEAEKRDHRKLGAKLDLYTSSEDIGPGLILWLPKGNIIKEELEKWAKETEEEWGYQRVTSPIITKEGLFYTSEHLPHYKDSMYAPMKIDNDNYYIKPMNCPFHHLIFKARPRSYREMPLRLAEYGWCHRYEQSGACFGLMRVRGMQMNDAHIYCTREQAVDEFVKVLKLHEYYYKKLGITDYRMELSLRDPNDDKYHGDEAMWEEAEELTKRAMEKSGIPFTVVKGGAAFYGPKMDFQVKSAIGREFTASTNQIDLFMPAKFELTYAGEDGREHTPICIHRAPLGTHERFIGFLIEHFAGKFPLWLSPEQVRILPVSDKHTKYAHDVAKRMRKAKLRANVDDSAESVSKKVRNAQLAQVNYILVVGEKEACANTVTVRTRDNKVHGAKDVEELITALKEEISAKSLTSSCKTSA